LQKEHMGVFVLIEFPFQILFAVLTGRWSAGDRPLQPWLYAFAARLLVCVAGPLLVYMYPGGEVTWTMYLAALSMTLLSSFTSTVMFVCLVGFRSRPLTCAHPHFVNHSHTSTRMLRN
jgi:MFS transporter, PAT family, solute carrier family 33 (acetyl-CoA transportor), member 1